MPREYARTLRLNAQLQRELATLIREELTDPRVAPVTVTRVVVSPDLRNASVFVSLLGDDTALDRAIAALGHAATRMRRLLGHRLHLRRIPELHFRADAALREGDRVSGLIRAAVDADRRNHENADESGSG